MNRFTFLLVVALLAGVLPGTSARAAAQAPAPRGVRLTFEPNGLVTLAASDVSVREVLQEWARQCGCVIVNAQNLQASLEVPVQFEHQRQELVLASLLKKAAGYVLTRRSATMTGPSDYETIYVLPTSNPVQSASPYMPPVAAYAPPPPTFGSPVDEIPPVTPIVNSLPRDPNVPASGAPPPANSPVPQRPSIPGAPSRFVPIVPVNSNEPPRAPAPSAPGAPTPPGTVRP